MDTYYFTIRGKTGNQPRFFYWQSEQRLAHHNRLIIHNASHEIFLVITLKYYQLWYTRCYTPPQILQSDGLKSMHS